MPSWVEEALSWEIVSMRIPVVPIAVEVEAGLPYQTDHWKCLEVRLQRGSAPGWEEHRKQKNYCD
jgi:hypothetical protein